MTFKPKSGKTSAGIALVLCLTSLLLVGAASAVPVTGNTDLGWQTLINNSYITGEVRENNTYVAMASLVSGSLPRNITLNINTSANNALELYQSSTVAGGQLYIGKLYPAGRVKTRFNMSVVKNASNNYVDIYDGGLSRVGVYGYDGYHRVYLKYYAVNGTFIPNYYFQQTGSYVDFTIDQYPNGTTTVTNNLNPLANLSAKYHEYVSYPYNLTTTTTYQLNPALSIGTMVRIYNFEQSVPKKQITVLSKNNEFPFGQDGPRPNYAGATNWLKAHNMTETFFAAPNNWAAFTADQKSDLLDMVNNRSFEVGVHFTDAFTAISWSAFIDEVNTEIPEIASIYGHMPNSWVSLGDGENTTHVNSIWNNWSGLIWRNNPDGNNGLGYSSIYAIYGVSTVSRDDNTGYWKTACQYGAFHGAYTHAVANPLNESSSVDTQNFTAIMDCYVANNVTIVPYGKWFYESTNTVQPINDILLDTYGSHFSIDSRGYNATTRIIDPFGERVWYSATPGMMVITEIDNGASETNLTIRNNATDPVIRQANASIVPSSGKILMNVKEWTTTGTAYKQWNESATDPAAATIHQIGDFAPLTDINVKKNGAMYGNFTTNSTGWMNFTYSDGYSDVMFEAEVGDPIASFTPPEVSILWWPNGQAFTDTSTGSPTAWNWTYLVEGIGSETSFNLTQNATFFPSAVGNYLIQLNASKSTGYNISAQQTWVNVSQVTFSPNVSIAYQYPVPVTFTKINTTIIDTVNWSFGDSYTSTAFSPVQHIYTVANNYTICLNATNSSYGYSNTSKTFELTSDDDIFLKSWDQYENATISDLKGVSWTNSGCTLSTTAPKFGTQSLQCTDGNNYIYSPSSSIWDRSAIAGEMEAWINITAYGAAGKPIIKRSSGTDGTTNGWGLYEYNTSGYFAYWFGNAATNHTTPFYLPLNTQTHLVLLRNTSQYWEVYKDGVKVNGGNYVGGLALDTANQFQIGASGLGTEVSFRLDEFRYTQGVSRFVSDFSVPFAAYRGSLTGFIDTSPNSTYRYKTDPGSIAGISNWTNGGTRNRTVQVQNISEANYLVGGGNFDPLHEQVRAVYLNFTNYPDLVLESYSIDNVGGIVAYNVSRGGTNKITALFDNRTNFLDVEVLYYNYTETSDDFQYFAYGTLINGTASFPIHNFIATPITYLTWTIYPNFSASSTMVPAGTPITFTDTTYGAPGGWTNYAWTFGDGGTSTNKNPVYTYTLPGTYTVGLTTSLVANSSVTNSTTKTSYITVTSSGSGSPVASFAGSPLITTANSTVTFTDSSTNSPLSWTWDFGDGSGSTLQNPAHSYITNGLYTVNLTATNAYGSNTLSRVAYINVTSSIPSSFAQQDIWMDGQYALTFHVTDASTAAPIPVVTITDSNGASTTTTNGTGYLTEPAGTVSVCFVVSSGYTNICKSYIVDADASYDVQLSTASTEVANTNIVYTQQQTRFIVQNSYGNPVVGAGITAYYVSSTLPSNSAEVLQKAFGINSAIAELMLNSSVAMDGNTGSDGSLTFMMFPSLTYNLTITNVPSEPWYISVNPRETEYTIHQPLVVANSSYQNKTMTNITFDEPNSSYIRFKATFRDLSGATTDVKYFVVNPTNHTLYYTIDLGNPGTNIVKDFNYTGPNVRGEPYWAYFNTTP